MITSCYPVLLVQDVPAAAAFFRDHFGFEVTFEADWYVSLQAPGQEIAVLGSDHPTVPAGYGHPASGVLVNIETDDVDAIWERVSDKVEVLLPLRDEPFGQRHFIARGPEGSLVDVITPIPPSEEFAAAFAPSA